MTSQKLTYVFAGSMIGGAIGYFLFTDSGRRVIQSARHLDPNKFPDKIEELRNVIEQRGQQVGRHVEAVRDRIMHSIDAGKEAYNDKDNGFENQIRRLQSRNGEITSSLHRAVDNLNNTIFGFEKSVLEPVYQVGTIVRAVKHGACSLINSEKKENPDTGFDPQRFAGAR
jgi:gas vesicle protein